MKIYTLSDTHFNHDNVIRYTGRPFASLQEMNEALIKNWNSVVGPEDLVLFLGDFCFGLKEGIPYFASRLNGRKVLIRGNHDRSKNLYREAGFQEVVSEQILPPGIVGNKKTILLTHKPRMGLSTDMVNIHGHIHDQLLDPTIYQVDRYFNVSVENINYTPIELQEIIKRMDW